MRVFYDRLVDDHDRAWLFSCVSDVTRNRMKEDFDGLFAHLAGQDDGHVTENDLRSLVFCDFGDPTSDARNYAEVFDVEQLRHVVENYLDEFNSVSKKPMDLVMFRSACVTVFILSSVVGITASIFVFSLFPVQ